MIFLPSLVIGVSAALILLVFVASFHVMRPRIERAIYYHRVAWQQKTTEEKQEAKANVGLWVACVAMLFVQLWAAR
jgi:hypothetical protein